MPYKYIEYWINIRSFISKYEKLIILLKTYYYWVIFNDLLMFFELVSFNADNTTFL